MAAESMDDSGAGAHSDARSDGPASEAALSEASSRDAAPSDAPSPDSAPSDARSNFASPVVGVRFANWSVDSPSVDVCLALHGTKDFRGPMLASAAAEEGDAGEGGVTGIFFTQVTSYFYVPQGRYDARFVVAGATDCGERGVAPDATSLPSLGAQTGLATFALMGDIGADGGSSTLAVTGFLDDTVVTVPEQIAVRFINAAPDVPSADLGTGPIVIPPTVSVPFFYSPLFLGVPFGRAGDAETSARTLGSGSQDVDPHGYALLPPLAGSAELATATSIIAPVSDAFGVRLGGTGQTVLAQEWAADIAAGSLVTLVLLDSSEGAPVDAGIEAGSTEGFPGQILLDGEAPLPSRNAASQGITLLQCFDNAGTVGLLANCSIIAP